MTVQVRNLYKSFSRKKVLDDLNADFENGKIHLLLGENGAGKSTLSKIICGQEKADSGELLLNGKKTDIYSAKDAIENGIVMVNQRPLLAEEISVKENILELQNYHSKKEALEIFRELKEKYFFNLDYKALIKNCSGETRFFTSFFSALLYRSSFIILDEPTALLGIKSRKKLYDILRQLKENGTTIVVITHSPGEFLPFTDTVTILAHGKVKKRYAGTEEINAFRNKNSLYSVDQSSEILEETRKTVLDVKMCMKAENVICRPEKTTSLIGGNFQVNYGEITLIKSRHNGSLKTFENLMTGLCAFSEIQFSFFDSENRRVNVIKKNLTGSMKKISPALLRKNKISFIPQDIVFSASHPALTVEQMLGIYCRRNSQKALEENAREIIKSAEVSIGMKEKCESLSGGMLQRLVIEREFHCQSDFLILVEPLQGLDYDYQEYLCRKLVSLAESGKAVLVISAAGFPETVCSKVYEIEHGFIKECTIKKSKLA